MGFVQRFPNDYTTSNDPRSILQIVSDIRSKSETALKNNFPKANVDTSSDKCISISGGSLSREVDIVPAIWYDSRNYQQTRQEHNRGVKILNKSTSTLLLNQPFLHIKPINDRDTHYEGNLKSVIRLMKNIIADMPEYKKNTVKALSSYDLAAIGYHMDQNLSVSRFLKLSLVEKTRAHLLTLCNNASYRLSLETPDKSRKIFDTSKKTDALIILSNEMNDLARSIASEIRPVSESYDPTIISSKIILETA